MKQLLYLLLLTNCGSTSDITDNSWAVNGYHSLHMQHNQQNYSGILPITLVDASIFSTMYKNSLKGDKQ